MERKKIDYLIFGLLIFFRRKATIATRTTAIIIAARIAPQVYALILEFGFVVLVGVGVIELVGLVVGVAVAWGVGEGEAVGVGVW
jgi:hypothetical protein